MPDLSEDKNLGKLCFGLKHMVNFEELKSWPENDVNAARPARKVDGDFEGVHLFSSGYVTWFQSDRKLMDIETLKTRLKYCEKIGQ